MYGSFFERYAFWKGLGIIAGLNAILVSFGFDRIELFILTFFAIVAIHMVYVDDRFNKLEEKIRKLNND